ncbi:MAG: hypothetical protein HYV63_29380 [Candidatus Schekmanbacteria bacterium]|nr:hypothetical protein [Candidatus Schekmanbacteria bacterium]
MGRSDLPSKFIIILVLTPFVYLYCKLTGNRALWRRWLLILRRYLPKP